MNLKLDQAHVAICYFVVWIIHYYLLSVDSNFLQLHVQLYRPLTGSSRLQKWDLQCFVYVTRILCSVDSVLCYFCVLVQWSDIPPQIPILSLYLAMSVHIKQRPSNGKGGQVFIY